MPYVQRNLDGTIAAVFSDVQDNATEELASHDPDLLAFFQAGDGTGVASRDAMSFLASSDQDMIRVLEDLIDILIDKNLVQMTDFAGAVQSKLLSRRQARGQIALPDPLVDDEPMF